MNRNRLKAALLIRGYGIEYLADVLKVSVSSIYRRMNGDVQFTVEEVKKVAAALSLSDDEVMQIFFTPDVAQNATAE